MAKMFGAPPLTEKDVKGDNDDDSGEGAAGDLLEAIKDKDPASILAAFKLLYGHCKQDSDKEASVLDDEDEDEY